MQKTRDNATDKQINYARNLGLQFPPDISKYEMTQLLDSHLSNDPRSSDEDRRIAKWFGFDNFTAYAGERALAEYLWDWLKEPGREEDLVSWFVFHVCKHIYHGKGHPRATGPDCVAVREIAMEFVTDKAAVKSVRRYGAHELTRFGEYLSPDQTEHRGGSVRTMAYLRAESLIAKHLGKDSK
jgi:hypothetical protein